jgi:hypothetical protein
MKNVMSLFYRGAGVINRGYVAGNSFTILNNILRDFWRLIKKKKAKRWIILQ